MPVRSLGRFTVRVDRKGGPVAYGFVLGTIDADVRDRTETGPRVAYWCEPDVLCWAKCDPCPDPRQVAIDSVQAQVDAALEAWGLLNGAWNEAGCPDGKGPQFPNTCALQEELRLLCRPIPGAIHRAVEAALLARGLPPLTESEANQIKALEGP